MSNSKILKRNETMRSLFFAGFVVCGTAYSMEENMGENSDRNIIPWGYAARQGKREHMEDRYKAVCDERGSFFGVFDGHGGSWVADIVAARLCRFFEEYLKKGHSVYRALYFSFRMLDEEICGNTALRDVGSTAAVCYIRNKIIHYAWCGDSRIVHVGKDGKVKYESIDHKPLMCEERERIERCGGCVCGNRLNGELAMSRAFGDRKLKDSSPGALIVDPEIGIGTWDDGDWLVVASDGFWDVVSGNYVPHALMQSFPTSPLDGEIIESFDGKSPQCAAARILRDNVFHWGSNDNIAVLFAGTPPSGAEDEEEDLGLSEYMDKAWHGE